MRSSPAAVPDAASVACELALLLAAAKPHREQPTGCECGKSKCSFCPRLLTDWRATFRGYCDAAANDARTARVCTRKHLVLASHKLLCQTCFAKGRENGRQTGKGKTMDLGTGIALLVAFLAVVILIIRGQSPIIMLLILAVLWAAIAGIGIDDIQKKVIQAGGVQYASAVIIIVFGAWFAQVLIQTGIAESVIR